ncbi:MAG: hypothetical protein ACRKGH_04765 [Dehalogenimonas sp.]
MKKKSLSLVLSLMAALAATFVLTIGVLAGVPSGPGSASANASTSSSDDWVIEEDYNNGASARAGALVGETSSGTAKADSKSSTYNSMADAYSSAFIGWESSGTANASAEANSTNKAEADADATAYAWIILGSHGTADATAVAEAYHDSYADADSFAKLISGASGTVTAKSEALATNGAYADTTANAILRGVNGNLYSWAWATADGQYSYANSQARLAVGESIEQSFDPAEAPESSESTPLAPGVFFDYDVAGSSFGIALLIVVDPSNIYSFAISNASGGEGAWATADIDGEDVYVGAGAGEFYR